MASRRRKYRNSQLIWVLQSGCFVTALGSSSILLNQYVEGIINYNPSPTPTAHCHGWRRQQCSCLEPRPAIQRWFYKCGHKTVLMVPTVIVRLVVAAIATTATAMATIVGVVFVLFVAAAVVIVVFFVFFAVAGTVTPLRRSRRHTLCHHVCHHHVFATSIFVTTAFATFEVHCLSARTLDLLDLRTFVAVHVSCQCKKVHQNFNGFVNLLGVQAKRNSNPATRSLG